MPLQDQTLSIVFGKGLDTKTDRKLIQVGKLELLQDAIFTTGNDIIKRNGYDSISTSIIGGGSLSGPLGLTAFSVTSVISDSSNSLYSYSPDLSGWTFQGAYTSIKVSKTPINKSGTNQVSAIAEAPSGVILGNTILYSWWASGQVNVAVVDKITNTVISTNPTFNSTPTTTIPQQKSLVLGATNLGFIYLDSSLTPRRPLLQILNASVGGGVSFSSNIIIDSTSSNGLFDCATTTTGAVLAYDTGTVGTPTVTVKTINTAGTVTNTATFSETAQVRTYSITVDPANGNVWVYYATGSTLTTTIYKVAIFDSSLNVILASTTIASSVTTSNKISNIIGVPAAPSGLTTQQRVFYQSSESQHGIDVINCKTFNSVSGVIAGGGGISLTNAIVASKSFVQAGIHYFCAKSSIPFINYNGMQGVDLPSQVGLQSTFYLMAVDTGSTLNTAQAGQLIAHAKSIVNIAIPSIPIPDPFLSNTNQWSIAFLQIDSFSPNSFTGTGASLGVVSSNFSFSDADLNRAINIGGTQIWNGGIVQAFDGNPIVELGFNLFPEGITLTQGTGGTIADGTYEYFATYRWTDLQGNIYESSPSPGKSITVTGGGGTANVGVIIPALTITKKMAPLRDNIQIFLYRTTNAGTIPFFVASTPNSISATNLTPFFSITDTLPDSELAGAEILYTNGGILANIAPPPSIIIHNHNNRLLTVNSENPNELIYSKTFLQGSGIGTSDELLIEVDSKGGAITGLATMDDKLIIFEQNLPLFISGDGANDAGENSTFSTPQFIPSDVGCNSSKSIVSFPGGVLFKSPKGIYLLARNTAIGYFGSDVEAYNNQDITSAIIVNSKNQIRFLTSSGVSLLYDYFYGQWSVFTNHQGFGADIVNGVYTYIRTDGFVFSENTTSYLDNTTSYRLFAKLAWFKFGGVQGFERIRQAMLLGQFTNGSSSNHKIQISAAYDFGTSFSTPIGFNLGAASTSGPVQYREFLPRQKCDSLQFIVEEVGDSGISGEFVSFSSLDLNIGVKKGLRKMPSASSVG